MNFYRFVRGAVGIYAKLVYRVKYYGRENEPAEGKLIILSNHSSFSDAIFTACSVKRDISFIAKSTLTKNPFLNWIFKGCNVITINRGDGDLQALRTACGALDEGKTLGIYPQGTRTHGAPKPEQAMAGVGLMASRSRASLLPVAICCGKNKKGKPCVFRKVRVYVGKPVTYEEYSTISERPSSHEIAEYAFGKVCELYEKYN